MKVPKQTPEAFPDIAPIENASGLLNESPVMELAIPFTSCVPPKFTQPTVIPASTTKSEGEKEKLWTETSISAPGQISWLNITEEEERNRTSAAETKLVFEENKKVK